MISIQSLSHVYEKGRKIKFRDWEIPGMEQWPLLGATGLGKSTLLNIILGLLIPTEGGILIHGTCLYTLSTKGMDRFRGRDIGTVFQRPHPIRLLNVLDNLEIAAVMTGLVK